LHGEHGYWSRLTPADSWIAMTDVSVAWKDDVKVLLDGATAATPGALVEEKTSSLAWHWRMAEPELGAARADELWHKLELEMQDRPVELLRGDKVVEVRSRGVSKAHVVERLLAGLAAAPTIAAMGDDATDEECFLALPPEGIAIGVGYRPTVARYRVATPRAARALLQDLVRPA
ncbi:MAG: trehalose-phosphatase, partial [Polyangiaceae bacterium]